jgi:hypothetical protein
MRRVYISGRIKGYPDSIDHFARAEHQLTRRDGHEVVNPHKIDAGGEPTYEDFMRADLKALLNCDAIYMLEGWERSVGARCEHMVAAVCGLDIFYERAQGITGKVSNDA